MLRRILAVAGVALAGLVPACVPAHAAEPHQVGDTVIVQAVCETKEFPELFVRLAAETGSFKRGVEMLSEKVASGECAALPVPVVAVIEEVGEQSIPFVDLEGDLVEARAVRVSRVWTVAVKALGVKGGRS